MTVYFMSRHSLARLGFPYHDRGFLGHDKVGQGKGKVCHDRASLCRDRAGHCRGDLCCDKEFLVSIELAMTESVKLGKNSIFLKNCKTVISVGNRKFYGCQMMKRTSPLNSSHKI